ncbi:MAG: type I glyceraldehyde-3-phosphate dehydrogenase [bacterium]|nr:type I glyceraldehyde-3-phosphate dehydrogenase [bacterium]
MKKIKVAINGFGRIGRAFLKVALARPDEIEIVAVNDLGDIKNMAYLLKYDTAYRASGLDIKVRTAEEGSPALIVNGQEIAYLSEKEPSLLPWVKLGVDVVVECTGLFTSYEKSNVHIKAGAKRVVISAPAKDDGKSEVAGATVLLGINEELMKGVKITSNASCTTNAASPFLAILDQTIGIEKALLNTVHGYTSSQGLVDGPNKKDFREGRAAAMNIVPSSTGAAIAVAKALPSLAGKFDGVSMRVPVVTGSIVDVTFISKKETSVAEVNEILKNASDEEKWKNIFAVTDEDLVSSDIIGNPHASIVDLKFTRVVGGNLVKVMAWYDNEMGYTYTLVEHVIKAGRLV